MCGHFEPNRGLAHEGEYIYVWIVSDAAHAIGVAFGAGLNLRKGNKLRAAHDRPRLLCAVVWHGDCTASQASEGFERKTRTPRAAVSRERERDSRFAHARRGTRDDGKNIYIYILFFVLHDCHIKNVFIQAERLRYLENYKLVIILQYLRKRLVKKIKHVKQIM